MKHLKIGDRLWRYTGVGIAEYEVFGIVEREVGKMYEVKCLNCNGHPICEMLLAHTKKDGYKYVDMISDEDQDYWHKDSSGYMRFHLTKNMAIIERNKWTIGVVKEQIQKSKDSIAKNEKTLLELQAIIDGLSEASTEVTT